MTGALLAHQGGWDELLLVAAPVVVIAVLLVIADRRAKRALDRGRGEPSVPGSAGDLGEPDDTPGPGPAG
ncbi:MAG: hypothetical protein GEV08_05150 [Acidimicrobiia bacterium]|nr:hypothetical protein [Acidimicrobiia bacterium]